MGSPSIQDALSQDYERLKAENERLTTKLRWYKKALVDALKYWDAAEIELSALEAARALGDKAPE